MSIHEVFSQIPLAIIDEYEEPRSKEEHMGDYIKSVKALEDAMEPYKEQKRELKTEYIDNGWLTKDDISLTVRAYRLLKNDVDMEALIDIYENLKGDK